jgi:hypothetical protein
VKGYNVYHALEKWEFYANILSDKINGTGQLEDFAINRKIILKDIVWDCVEVDLFD